ncbi:putative uncharacterized protein C3orf56 homolog [Ailuropoda melanoleuca]|uniref:putative uncharacterized protein C3orf56 homolog n=1 Tax=Ailuropoda melanoleuca TaxID=9646 RepID=UPI00149499A4|nr:putative uncharacterized protein C3orf56 homolog [Ailuropoda melanoleuca]
MGAPGAVHSWMRYPALWSYTWAPFVSPFWMGLPPPAAPVPSVWPSGFSSFDPQVGSQYLATVTSSVFPYPMGPPLPPLPYSSVPPALSGDDSGHSPQVEWQIRASSAFLAAAGGPSRRAPHLERCQAPPSEWASRFSPGAPGLPCSPELCPLPPQPDPRCPRSPRLHCKACCRLF